MKKKLDAKENLLRECEREIRNIREQYSIIESVLDGKRHDNRSQDKGTREHGLLRGGKKAVLRE